MNSVGTLHAFWLTLQASSEHTTVYCMQALLTIASRRNTRCHPNRSGRLFPFSAPACVVTAHAAARVIWSVAFQSCAPTASSVVWTTQAPILLLTCILHLRPLKGWLVAREYFYKAEEARFGTTAPTQPLAAPPADKDPRST